MNNILKTLLILFLVGTENSNSEEKVSSSKLSGYWVSSYHLNNCVSYDLSNYNLNGKFITKGIISCNSDVIQNTTSEGDWKIENNILHMTVLEENYKKLKSPKKLSAKIIELSADKLIYNFKSDDLNLIVKNYKIQNKINKSSISDISVGGVNIK